MIRYPDKSDGSLIAFDLIGNDYFKNVLKELENRKYDVKTLCIYVERREMDSTTQNNISTWIKDVYQPLINKRRIQHVTGRVLSKYT